MGEDQSQTGRRRLTVAEASAVLGVTVEAVRGRIKRGTLDHERTDKGVFVLLEEQSYDQSTDRTSTRPPTGCDLIVPRSYPSRTMNSAKGAEHEHPRTRSIEKWWKA